MLTGVIPNGLPAVLGLDIEGLITRRIAFGRLNDAITALRRGDAIRQVVTFG